VPQVVIALGSNLGDRLANLRAAVGHLSHVLTVERVARIYETAPMYVTDQPAFLNSALLAETDKGPIELLHHLKVVERQVGRTPAERNGPREIDIDLILWGGLTYAFHDGATPILQIPHPRLKERRFVLQPLSDLGVDALPGLGSLENLLTATENQADSVVTTEHGLLPVHRSG
jgi:2-amino-4-hydroxy-6-hydroxymethyldihydropteridine diphosphokinase